MLKGEPNQWAIRGGNAQSGCLSTVYSGVRPSGYNPMQKQGAIILGIGGDNSNDSAGTFYEGVMTSGYPSYATETAVQANIVAVGYAASNCHTRSPPARASPSRPPRRAAPRTTSPTTTPTPRSCSDVTSSSSATVKDDATWIVHPGLANSSCVSFESANGSGDYIRHYNFELYLEPNDGTTLFAPGRHLLPEGRQQRLGLLLHVVQLQLQVHPALQLYRVRRQRRRLQRLGRVQPLVRRQHLGRRLSLELTLSLFQPHGQDFARS